MMSAILSSSSDSSISLISESHRISRARGSWQGLASAFWKWKEGFSGVVGLAVVISFIVPVLLHGGLPLTK